MFQKPSIVWFLFMAALFSALPSSGHATDDLFPEYTVVKPNVSFWINIYTQYTTGQAVVHDNRRLDIVYGVIDLEPVDSPGARKINRQRMKAETRKYDQILEHLAANPSTNDAEARRVATLFGPDANPREYQRARHRIRCQVGQRDRFRAGLVRSGGFIDRIRIILHTHGVPEDLAYLPHVESSFDVGAYSKFGAAGMWQFTRSTGRRFLTVDHVLDERRDPFAATHAAAMLLKENYEKLGSWPLAITAYNHGATGMQRAKAAHGVYPRIFTDYRGRTFKFASRNFYSEFLAARKIASNYRHYFGQLHLNPPVRIRSVPLTGFAAFDDLCRHFGFDQELVRSMNPALRPPVLSGQKYVPKDYVLNLPGPAEYDGGVLLADIPAHIYKRAQKPSRFYTVQRGDTASKIARMHRVNLDDLILANNLDRRATVYIRQTLRIPQKGESHPPQETDRPASTGDNTIYMAAAQNPEKEDAILQGIPEETDDRRYRRPGPAPADLMAMADDMQDDASQQATESGQESENLAVAPDIGFHRLVQSPSAPLGIIRVEDKETVGHYAEWADVAVSQIQNLNDLPSEEPLRLHQQIQIPLDRVSAETFASRRLAFHTSLTEGFFAAYRMEEIQQYQDLPGDDRMWEEFDMPMWLLRHYNDGVNPSDLHQSLIIPAVETIREEDAGAASGTSVPDA
jgi:membrane-bound lytic murein transglycosylase D